MSGPPGGPPPVPPGSEGSALVDWGLALILGLYPLVGITLGLGDALTLFGIVTIVAVGVRLEPSSALRRPLLASGISVLLVLLCLWIHDGGALAEVVRLLLAGVLTLALLRGRLRPGSARRLDVVSVGVGLAVVLVIVGLAGHGAHAAASALTGLSVSLGLVFGLYRFHLRGCERLPMLARTGALSATAAVIVAVGLRVAA